MVPHASAAARVYIVCALRDIQEQTAKPVSALMKRTKSAWLLLKLRQTLMAVYSKLQMYQHHGWVVHFRVQSFGNALHFISASVHILY